MPTLPELIAKGRAEFNDKFRYFAGKPKEGSLELTHNNVRDFLETYAIEVWNAAIDAALGALPGEDDGLNPGTKLPDYLEKNKGITIGWNDYRESAHTNLQALTQ